MNCEHCEEKHDRIREATYTDNGYALCDDCLTNAAEAAHERMLADFYGGSGCQTVNEQYQAAAQMKRGQR